MQLSLKGGKMKDKRALWVKQCKRKLKKNLSGYVTSNLKQSVCAALAASEVSTVPC